MNTDTIHHVTLFSDAKARTQRFAICDREREPVWYGRFFDNDLDFSGEQSTGELSAAKKAIWLAGQVKKACEAKTLHLKLIVDANWLCTLRGKAEVLIEEAHRAGVRVEMKWLKGKSNPADAFTTGGGFLKWSETHLPALAVLKTQAEIDAETEEEKEVEMAEKEKPVLRRPDCNQHLVKFNTKGVTEADLNEWLNSHKEEWATMLASCNAAGMARKERQEKRAEAVAAWIAAEKPSATCV